MNSPVKYLHIILTIILIGSSMSMPANINQVELELKDQGKSIENVIEINLSSKEYFRANEINGHKITIRNPLAKINGDSIIVRDMHTRGNTTLHYRRKSYSFSLDTKVTFMHSDRIHSMKKFNAISLSMDKYYFRNRLAFELLEEIKLFGLFYTYCELIINGQSEGIYLILERPQDFALKQKKSPLVIRRGYDQRIDKIKTGKKIDKPEAKNYKNYYTQIYKSLKKYEGKELYDVLSQWVDLEMYMKWLAFNFFIRNGDYTDEVYFCIAPVENRFKIIPWDYDDIFAREPHEGNNIKIKAIGDKYIFSSEDRLDQTIANDPYLYQLYLEQLKIILTQISEEMLSRIFQNTYAELYPYYSDSDIIGMARFDALKNPDIKTLENSMKTSYTQLVNSRNIYLSILNK